MEKSTTTHMWDVSLTWNTIDVEAYSPQCYTSTATVECGTTASQEVIILLYEHAFKEGERVCERALHLTGIAWPFV